MRKADHLSKWRLKKGHPCASWLLFDEYGTDCKWEVIEKVSEEDRYTKERFWVEQLNAINFIRPIATEEEHKKQKAEWFQRYKVERRDEYLKKCRVKYSETKSSTIEQCECGKTYTRSHRKRHFSSAYHLSKVNTQ
jgi:hypothetical protein